MGHINLGLSAFIAIQAVPQSVFNMFNDSSTIAEVCRSGQSETLSSKLLMTFADDFSSESKKLICEILLRAGSVNLTDVKNILLHTSVPLNQKNI